MILHFGTVDYEAIVYTNKKEAGRHRSGYTSFWFDITGLVIEGENTVTVCAIDDVRAGHQLEKNSLNYTIPMAVTIPAPPAYGRWPGWSSFSRNT